MAALRFALVVICLLSQLRLYAADDCVDVSSILLDDEEVDCDDIIDIYGSGICSDDSVIALCCATCEALHTGNPDCPYGDLESFTVDEVSHTCDSVIDDYDAQTVCPHSDLGDWCCETCQDLDTGDPDCPFGDAEWFIIDDVEYDCDSSIGQYGVNIVCGDETVGDWCCDTCGDLVTGDPNCPFGDEPWFVVEGDDHNCDSAIDDYDDSVICQHETIGEFCCETCSFLHSGDEDCQYGDLSTFTVDDVEYTCDSVIYTYGAELVCEEPTLNEWCCDACGDRATGDPDCPYGDVYDQFILNDDPHDCTSSLAQYTALVICEDEALSEICCGSCAYLATGDPNCPYGNIFVSLTINDVPGYTCTGGAEAFGYDVLCAIEDIQTGCCETCGTSVGVGRK